MFIKTTNQPLNSSAKLNNKLIDGGGFSDYKVYYGQQYVQSKYTFMDKKTANSYTIQDINTRHLIEHGILPLNLTWHGKYDVITGGYVIVIDWSHWDNKEKE